MKASSERDRALEILFTAEKERDHTVPEGGLRYPVERALQRALRKDKTLSSSGRAFVTRVVLGTVQTQILLDYYIDAVSSTPVANMKPFIRCLLRMSVYQILYLDKTPDAAVCNEAVTLAASHGFSGLKGFVNGVLRTVCAQKEALTLPEGDGCKALSVRYAMPERLCRLLVEEEGLVAAKTILQASMEERPVFLRIRAKAGGMGTKEDTETFCAQMADRSEDVQCEGASLLPYAARVLHGGAVEMFPGYAEGRFQAMDLGAMLCVTAAGIKPGNQVLDVCAAPGGKALMAADLLLDADGDAGRFGHVTALDVSKARCARIEENVKRLRLPNVTAGVRDATVKDASLVNSADVLLCDLPCSGLGVMARKPEIRHNVDEKRFCALVQLQRQILDTVWEYVKPGGTLLYATCTIRRAENEEQMQYLLERYPFSPVNLEERLPSALHATGTLRKGYCKLLPGVFDTDGFFFAVLQRRADS